LHSRVTGQTLAPLLAKGDKARNRGHTPEGNCSYYIDNQRLTSSQETASTGGDAKDKNARLATDATGRSIH